MFKLIEESTFARVYRLEIQALDGEEAGRFAAESESLDRTLPVVLDLSALLFADSSGIGCLLSLQRSLSEGGTFLNIVGLQPRVRSLFELVQLHRVVDVFNDADEALRSIEAGVSPAEIAGA